MERYAYILREIAERVDVPTVKQLAARPEMRDVYRVTMHYPDQRATDAVATLMHASPEGALLEVIYLRHFGHRPLKRQLSTEAYRAFAARLRKIPFDKLGDQEGVAHYGVDLCMVERAAGGFARNVIFAPQNAAGPYATLLETIHEYLPEALREIKP
jgi:hypothetical protein